MNKAAIALGSNIDPEKNIQEARQVLAKEFIVRAESSFVWTRPIGLTNQPDFLNGVVLLETVLERPAFEARLKEIELELGRQKRQNKFGPREIDLDIVVWDGQVVDRDFYQRDFLHKAVREILPELKTTMRCC